MKLNPFKRWQQKRLQNDTAIMEEIERRNSHAIQMSMLNRENQRLQLESMIYLIIIFILAAILVRLAKRYVWK